MQTPSCVLLLTLVWKVIAGQNVGNFATAKTQLLFAENEYFGGRFGTHRKLQFHFGTNVVFNI